MDSRQGKTSKIHRCNYVETGSIGRFKVAHDGDNLVLIIARFHAIPKWPSDYTNMSCPGMQPRLCAAILNEVIVLHTSGKLVDLLPISEDNNVQRSRKNVDY